MLYAAFRFTCLGLLLPCLLFSVVLSHTAEAQLSGKIAERPIAVGYARNMPQKRIFDYALSLTERLDIAATMRSLMSGDDIREQFDGTQPQVDEPVSGVVSSCMISRAKIQVTGSPSVDKLSSSAE